MTIEGKKIDYADKITLLGITFDRFLKLHHHTINICKKVNVKLFTLLRCAHLFNVGFKITLFKLFIQSHFDYYFTVYSHLSTVSYTRINFSRALFRLARINIKDVDITSQLETLTPFKIIPLPLRLCYRFNAFLFSLCKRNQQSDIFKYIDKQRNAKNNLILPK